MLVHQQPKIKKEVEENFYEEKKTFYFGKKYIDHSF